VDLTHKSDSGVVVTRSTDGFIDYGTDKDSLVRELGVSEGWGDSMVEVEIYQFPPVTQSLSISTKPSFDLKRVGKIIRTYKPKVVGVEDLNLLLVVCLYISRYFMFSLLGWFEIRKNVVY
jgi:hypothetical protein